MNTRAIFFLAVRLVGLYFLYLGLITVPTAFVVVTTSLGPILLAVYYLIIGLWLMCGLRSMANKLYPKE